MVITPGQWRKLMAGKKRLTLPARGERRGYTTYRGLVPDSMAKALGNKHRDTYCYVRCGCPGCMKLQALQVYAVRLERWKRGEIQTACKSLKRSKYKAFIRRRMDSLTFAQKVSIFKMAHRAEYKRKFPKLAKQFNIAGSARTQATVIAGVLATIKAEVQGMAKTMREYRFLFARLRELRNSNPRPDMTNKRHKDAVATAQALINKYGHLTNVADWIKRDLELAAWATATPERTPAASVPSEAPLPKPAAREVAAPVKKQYTVTDFIAHGVAVESDFDTGGRRKRYPWTAKGLRWIAAGELDLSTWVDAAPAPEPPKVETAPETRPEDKLRPLIPYLDGINFGFVSFSRVPRNMREIDGKPIRDLLLQAGIIADRNVLTEKGKAWLNPPAQS